MNAPNLTASGHVVLVIDDNPIIQRAVYFSLRDHGIKVLMCGDVSESLHIIREQHPVLIVLDINFPPDPSTGGVRDGFWALDWLRHVKEISDTPVVMISSEDAEKVRPRALAAGAREYLQKPLDKAELVAIALDVIAKKKASVV